MKIEIEELGNKRIVRLEGRMDANTTPMLEKRINDLLDHGHTRILIDFSKVDYLSSAGMRLMLAATKKAKSKQGHLIFSGMIDDVMEIVKMAGFHRILHIVANEALGLEALE